MVFGCHHLHLHYMNAVVGARFSQLVFNFHCRDCQVEVAGLAEDEHFQFSAQQC